MKVANISRVPCLLSGFSPKGARFVLFSPFESRPFGAGGHLLIQTQCSARLSPCCALGYRISPHWGCFLHRLRSDFSPVSGSGRPVAPHRIREAKRAQRSKSSFRHFAFRSQENLRDPQSSCARIVLGPDLWIAGVGGKPVCFGFATGWKPIPRYRGYSGWPFPTAGGSSLGGRMCPILSRLVAM